MFLLADLLIKEEQQRLAVFCKTLVSSDVHGFQLSRIKKYHNS